MEGDDLVAAEEDTPGWIETEAPEFIETSFHTVSHKGSYCRNKSVRKISVSAKDFHSHARL